VAHWSRTCMLCNSPGFKSGSSSACGKILSVCGWVATQDVTVARAVLWEATEDKKYTKTYIKNLQGKVKISTIYLNTKKHCFIQKICLFLNPGIYVIKFWACFLLSINLTEVLAVLDHFCYWQECLFFKNFPRFLDCERFRDNKYSTYLEFSAFSEFP
jgi:hypothetical protein